MKSPYSPLGLIMARLTPVSWRELVSTLKAFGFQGPYQEGKPPYMVKGNLVLTLPNPHRREVSVDLFETHPPTGGDLPGGVDRKAPWLKRRCW